MALYCAVFCITFTYHTPFSFIFLCYFPNLIEPYIKLGICLFYVDDIKNFSQSGRQKLPHKVFFAYGFAYYLFHSANLLIHFFNARHAPLFFADPYLM